MRYVVVALLLLAGCKSRGTYDFEVIVPTASKALMNCGGAFTQYQMIISPGSCSTPNANTCPTAPACAATSSTCIRACDQQTCPLSDFDHGVALPELPAGDYAVQLDVSNGTKSGSLCQDIRIDRDGTHSQTVTFDFPNASALCCSCCRNAG